MLKNYDVERHNAEYAQLLAEQQRGQASRVSMTLSFNPRLILMNPVHNPEGYTFQQYLQDPEIMLEIQMRLQKYKAENLPYDHFMGFGREELSVYTDFQNLLDSCWFGGEVCYHDSDEPSTKPFLTEENKYDILKKGLLDPFSGPMATMINYWEFFKEKIQKGYTYCGIPLQSAHGSGTGGEGIFTTACCLRGPGEMCIDLYEDRSYALELLDFITENLIQKIKAVRQLFGESQLSDSMYLADDDIALLSESDYVELILPFHKKFLQSLSTGKAPNSMHLCGDASRHFKVIRDELYVREFDTGFPIDHAAVLTQLGTEVTIQGGVPVDLLLLGTPQQVKRESEAILQQVLPASREGKNFVMKEANNLSPNTPEENILAMYETVKAYGRY